MTGKLRSLQPSAVVSSAVVALYLGTLLFAGAPSFAIPALGHTAAYRTTVLMGIPIALAVGIALWQGAQETGAGLAFKDDLTGLSNRRAFVVAMEKALANAKAGRVGIILYDVDGLKSINDRCGHQSGDELLRLAGANLVKRSARAGTAYRIGGDEFAVLVDRRMGGRLARVVQSIKGFEAEFESCGHIHQVRLSAGYASISDGEGFDSLFRRADARLRAHKERLYEARPVRRRTLEALAVQLAPPGPLLTELARPEVLRRNLHLVGSDDSGNEVEAAVEMGVTKPTTVSS